MNKEKLVERIRELEGHIGFYYKNLVTGDIFGYNEGDSFEAASLPKLAILLHVLKGAEEGKWSLSDKILVKEEQKVGGCGAIKSMVGDALLEISTLCRLMITISDNTATNALIRLSTLEGLAEGFKNMGLEKTQIQREYFDEEAATRGLANYVCPIEMGKLLEQIYSRTFHSESVSEMAEEILLLQQIRHKIPGYIGRSKKIANKTGETGNTTHDAAIVFAKEPFVLVICSELTNVPETERFIREVALELYEN